MRSTLLAMVLLCSSIVSSARAEQPYLVLSREGEAPQARKVITPQAYPYGYFGAQTFARKWSSHTGYGERYFQWTGR